MYPKFIIDINKSHQYEAFGDRYYGVSNLQDENCCKTIKFGSKFSLLHAMWNHNLSVQNVRGEKGKWKT